MADLTSRFGDKAFWTELVPGLRIEDPASFESLKIWDVPGGDEAALRALLDHEGYVHMPAVQELVKVEEIGRAHV